MHKNCRETVSLRYVGFIGVPSTFSCSVDKVAACLAGPETVRMLGGSGAGMSLAEVLVQPQEPAMFSGGPVRSAFSVLCHRPRTVIIFAHGFSLVYWG